MQQQWFVRLPALFLAGWGMGLLPLPARGIEFYRLTDLGQMSSTAGEVRHLTEDGLALVRPGSSGGLILDHGDVVDLAELVGAEMLFQANDMNEEGLIVGRAYFPSLNQYHAVALTKANPGDRYGTQLVDLGLGDQYSSALSVNDSGRILFAHSAQGPPYSLGSLDSRGAFLPDAFSAHRVGFRDMAVGSAMVPPDETGQPHAALVDAAGLQDLGVLPHDPDLSDWADALNLSPNGQYIVGASGNFPQGLKHAALWAQPGSKGAEDLDVEPHPEYAGATEARAVNNRGEIVGRVGGLFPHAALFRDGKVIDLNQSGKAGIILQDALGWTLQSADAINGRGEIAGWGNTAGGREVHAFLLSPVRLRATRQGDQLVVSWPDVFSDYVLEQNSDPTDSAGWRKVTRAPVNQNHQLLLIFLIQEQSSGFFRLSGF